MHRATFLTTTDAVSVAYETDKYFVKVKLNYNIKLIDPTKNNGFFTSTYFIVQVSSFIITKMKNKILETIN